MNNSQEALIQWQSNLTYNNRLKEELSTLKKEEGCLKTNLVNWEGAKILLELLKNYKLENRKDFILKIINTAMVDIFQENYRLDILPSNSKGKVKKYDIIFFQNEIEIAKNEELLISNGGGVLSVASLFFKILIGYLYSKNKFYIFDEALSQVSSQFRGKLSQFLRTFCEEYDFTLVIVSQTSDLDSFAHIVYEVDAITENNLKELKIINTTIDIPLDDYYYSKIKNFQSIKNLEFKYKGFTVIRGPNNCGKSASLRAIESIIFNTFNVNNYPRKNSEATSIIFGAKGKFNNEIGLKYIKNKKVIFNIGGEDYYGKSLASEKLQEEVEKIGFKYINIKKLYKNFKGDLKNQTERLAYTNQFDNLFLIGSKNTDSEKIFNFLFNTEGIAIAITSSKETISEDTKRMKEVLKLIETKEDEIKKYEVKIEFYLKTYYSLLIKEFIDNKLKCFDLESKYEKIKQLYEKFESSILRVIDLKEYLKNNEKYSFLKNQINVSTKKITILETLVEKISLVEFLERFIYNSNKLKSLNKNINSINNIISTMEFYNYITYFLKLNEKYYSCKNYDIDSFIDNSIEDMNKKYNMKICKNCEGLGILSI